MRFETVIPSESNLCEATRDFIPEISSLYSGISDQISDEQKRRGALGQELAGVRSSKENIDKQVAKLNEIEVVPVFPRKKYINTFHHFRKGQFDKSALSFKKSPQLNPPYFVIDNILFGLGLSYFKMNKLSEAMGALTRVIEEHPRSDKWFMAHVVLGSAHERNAEKSQAFHILEKALSQNPPTAIRSLIDRLINLVHDEVAPMTS